MILPTGNPRLDAYLARGYDTVRGMSSAFAASLCGHLLRRQREMGIAGPVGEIGTFEGRFFIALGLSLAPDEHAVGIDVFTWPSEAVLDHLHANCRAHGLAASQYTAIKGNTRALAATAISAAGGDRPFRFFHIDGEHDDANVTADLDLVAPLMHAHGLICLDDMLHPGYPELTESVHRWLRANPAWRVLAILDREDIVAAAKYVLCRVESLGHYEKDLLEAFPAQVFPMGADVVGHFTAVLTPHPRLAAVD